MKTIAQTDFIPVSYQNEDLSIAVRLRPGSDDLVLLLHGFGCTKESFDEAFQPDGLQDFSLCAFDFPGHGQSSRAHPSTYSLQSYAEVTRLLVSELDYRRVFMVCHSMGAAAGLLAAPYIDGLAHLSSIEGNLVAADCGLVSRGTASQSTSDFIQNGYGEFASHLATSPRDDFRSWARWYKQADPLALHKIARSLVKWSDSGELLKRFLSLGSSAYIYGDEDSKNYLLPDLHDVLTCRIAAAGHFAMLDNPGDFYTALGQILSFAQASVPARAAGPYRVPSLRQ